MDPSLIKKIKIGAIILILIVVGYFILRPTEEKYFDKIDIKETVSISNFTEQSYLDTIVRVGLNIMEIDTVYIQIRPLTSDQTSPDDIELQAGIIDGGNNVYIIFVEKSSSRTENINRISHELIHLRDYYNKTLILFDEYGAIYGFDEWEDFRVMEYQSRPWEIEAYSKGPELAKQIEEKLYSKN